VWLVIVKGGINTRASARYEFGLGALSSHAASQSPSTIRGVPAVWEGDIITALNRRMGVTYGRNFFTFKRNIFLELTALVFYFLMLSKPVSKGRNPICEYIKV